MEREIFLHGRNFFRFCGLIGISVLVFFRLGPEFYLVSLLDTSLQPHTLLVVSYFAFLILPWALATVYFRHSTNRYVRLVSRMLIVWPLVVGGFVLNSYLHGYELLLWTPFLLIRRRWTLEEAGEWLNDLLLRNNMAVSETVRLEWLQKALEAGHSRSEIQLDLLRSIKAEAARQKESLPDLSASGPGGWYETLAYCFDAHPVASWAAVTLVTLALAGVAFYCFRSASPPPMTTDGPTRQQLAAVRQELIISHRALKQLTEDRFTELKEAQPAFEQEMEALVQKQLDARQTEWNTAFLNVVKVTVQQDALVRKTNDVVNEMQGRIDLLLDVSKNRFDEQAARMTTAENLLADSGLGQRGLTLPVLANRIADLENLAGSTGERAQLANELGLDRLTLTQLATTVRALQAQIVANVPQNAVSNPQDGIQLQERLAAVEALLGTAEERQALATEGSIDHLTLPSLAEKIDGIDTDLGLLTAALEAEDNPTKIAQLRALLNLIAQTLGLPVV